MAETPAPTFEGLQLIEPLLRAVRAEGYERPTPIQTKAIPHVLAGRDVLGCAQTGTGKTAAFALPILQRLYREVHPTPGGAPVPAAHGAHPAPVSYPAAAGHAPAPHGAHAPRARRPIRALVLSPTRELAAQIGTSFAAYGRHTGLRHTVIYGGVGQNPQVSALHHGVDILVATPGRMLDLMGQGFIQLGELEVFVLDEADRMLDMGFIPDVRRIVSALPRRRQTLFFSATLTPDIQRLAGDIVRDPVRVEAAPAATTVDTVLQQVYLVEGSQKRDLLVHLLKDPTVTRALVFTRTKHGADRVERQLRRAGIQVQAIHGNKSQKDRERALGSFRSGQARVLVATDIAARGLDVDDISHVFNFDLPDEPEAYVHRIGRTARAEASGVAVSFCSPEEREQFAAIQRLIRMHPELMTNHPYHASSTSNAPAARGAAPAPGVPTFGRMRRRSFRRR